LATDQVVKGLRSLIKGKTTIIISHNLRLIRSADRVLVVEGGRIVQSGTHDELSRQPGAYADFGLLDAHGPNGGLVEVEQAGAVAVKETVNGVNGANGVEEEAVGVKAAARQLLREVDRSRRIRRATAPQNGSRTNGSGRSPHSSDHPGGSSSDSPSGPSSEAGS
jgi:ABC-type glutathione transport system ATPase component